MTGGKTSSSTTSGASSIGGKPGTSASMTPASTNRMASGILSRSATTATAATTPRRSTKISIVRANSSPSPMLPTALFKLDARANLKSSFVSRQGPMGLKARQCPVTALGAYFQKEKCRFGGLAQIVVALPHAATSFVPPRSESPAAQADRIEARAALQNVTCRCGPQTLLGARTLGNLIQNTFAGVKPLFHG